MKKIISVILTSILLLTANVWVCAEETDSKINFSLQCGGKNTVTVKAGTEIQVDLLLENEEPYRVFTLADEIEFDETFFDYIGEITPKTDKISGEKQSYTDGVSVIKIIGSYTAPKTYETEQHIVSFKLKVKDTATGYGMVISDPETVMVCGNTNYKVKNTDLTVIIGDGDSDQRVLTFETNGGTMETTTVVKNKGATVDLSKYIPAKSGYTFAGWYSDSALSSSVSRVLLNDNTTVYAKWNAAGGGSVGGGGSGAISTYKLTFETNGGTAVDAVSFNKNTTVDLSKYNTAKSGCIFDGWYTDKELTNKASEIKITANTTVYAKWLVNDSDSANYKPSIFSDEHHAYIVGKEDGCFYPDSNLTRAETAEMLYRLLDKEERTGAQTTENTFTDVNGDDWFNISVSTLANLGVINGRTPETFAPNEQITRAEFTAMLVRVSDISYSGKDLFTDISGHWANAYINNAASVDWVNGENGMFRPDDSITRAEAVTLLNRVLCRIPESKSDLLDNMITPPDNSDESSWYYLAVQEAVNSHNYELKSDGVHEKWTSLTENPDWANLNN